MILADSKGYEKAENRTYEKLHCKGEERTDGRIDGPMKGLNLNVEKLRFVKY